MRVEKKVDYLQWSTERIPIWERVTDEPQKSNMAFYESMWTCNNGVRIYSGNPNSRRYLCVATGTSCDNLRHGGDIRDWLADELMYGAKFTRVDWAITQEIDNDPFITPQHIANIWASDGFSGAWANYPCKAVSSFDRRTGDDDAKINVETVYVGDMERRAKKGLMRAYDKGLEMDLSRYLITRIEAEERRDNAHTSVKRHIEGSDIASIVKSRISSSDAIWNAVLDAPSIDISRQEQQKSDDDSERLSRWAWLMNQVAPALGRQMADDVLNGYGHENYFELLRQVKRHYDERMRDEL